MALEEGYCVLCWRRKRRGEGTSVRSRRGYSFDLKQWRRDHWLNFVLSIVDCIWTQTKRGSYSPTIYILHFSPSFSCFLRLTTDVTMGIRANLQRRSFLATFLSLFLDFFPQNLVLLQNLRVECSVAVYLSKALCTRPFLTTSLSSMLLFLYPILPWELVCNWTYDVVNSGVLTHLPFHYLLSPFLSYQRNSLLLKPFIYIPLFSLLGHFLLAHWPLITFSRAPCSFWLLFQLILPTIIKLLFLKKNLIISDHCSSIIYTFLCFAVGNPSLLAWHYVPQWFWLQFDLSPSPSLS